jgi:hypothetical protein
MATTRRQVKKIKFALTRPAIAGIGVICFCIFLWMFLLGVWASEFLLQTTAPTRVEIKQTAKHSIGLTHPVKINKSNATGKTNKTMITP